MLITKHQVHTLQEAIITIDLLLGETLREALVEVEHELITLQVILLASEGRGLGCRPRVDAGVSHVVLLLPHQSLLLVYVVTLVVHCNHTTVLASLVQQIVCLSFK